MKVLVTGGTGFVGLSVLEALLKNGHDIRVLTRESSPNDRLPDGVTVAYGDVCTPETLSEPVSKVDAVVHLAAIYTGYAGQVDRSRATDRSTIRTVNVGGTENLISAATEHDVDRFVFASTINAHPDVPAADQNEYVQSKIEAQRLFDDVDAFHYNVLFPTYVVGPGDHRLARFAPFQRVAANRVISLPMYVPGTYNVVDVRDVARSVTACLESDLESKQVIAGQNVSTGTFFRQVSKASDANCTVLPEPSIVTDYVLPPIVEKLHDRGIYPVDGETFREGIAKGVVPTEMEESAPVGLTPLRTTLRDAYEWYERVGLL